MAILAPPDWQYSPRDPAMDKGPAQSSSSTSNSQSNQQRPHQLPPPQQQHHPQQYPFQQQPQGNWTPSLAAPPFYPGAFYQNGPLTPQQGPQPYPTQANPYFDPANAQLAQWAYQQMMFNAQQHGHVPQQDFFTPPNMHGQFNPFPSGTPPPRPNDAPQPQYAGFHPYRRPSRQQSSHSESNVPPPPQQQDWRPQPPYSRPDASGSSSSVNSQGRPRTNSNNSQSRGSAHSHSPSPVPSIKGSPTSSSSNANNPGPPRIPHHRAASSSSTHSAHSATSPTPTSPSSGSSASSSAAKLARPSPLSQGTSLPPTRSPLSSSATSATRAERRISRDDSSLALSSLSLLATRAEAAAASSNSSSHAKEAPVKGSGLKGRLRRALSFNASVALKEEVGGADDTEDGDGAEGEDGGESDSDASIKASVVNPKNAASKAKTPALIASATRKQPAPSASALSPSASALAASSSISPAPSSAGAAGTQVPMPKKKSRAASLFNSRMNVSTDNISLSSTVSSASVMIRKLGSMGRLARRNSLAGITGLFKDRKKNRTEGDEPAEEGEEGEPDDSAENGKKKKGKEKEEKKKAKAKAKTGKGEASEASVSHATAELEAGDWSVPDAVGLSPAAKLARQHTLKSNAEAAAKAKEAAARAAAASANANANGNGVNGGVNGGGVPAWERNTATRSPGKQRGGVTVAEDGTRVLVEDSESEDEQYAPQGPYGQPQQQQQYGQQQQQQQYVQQQQQQWDDEDDEEWGLLGGEEDDTIRVGDAYPQQEEYDDDEHEPWAVDIRRSAERTRKPARGILKHAGTYDQASYLSDAHSNTLRARSNSYTSPQGQSELGPLARMPSPDPDHIDGLHRHGSHSSGHGDSSPNTKRSSVPSLPPLAFETGGSVFDSPQVTPTVATYAAAGQGQPSPTTPTAAPTGAHAIFNHPALNSSAPALTSFSTSLASPVPRAATAPTKKQLAFASNLSVYDTFSASMYDRRSEPATWSRLTPALAQRIKEELNSYKMEEMEVHAASRIHTQFFV
ncbi:hypothetical protein B0H13DRAFT_1921189 [Mycena leptocephala]|nr:hypothetical protein B0H13DRAFT_1921189 [Mycena leptocephala]